jgi:hypothetical protein
MRVCSVALLLCLLIGYATTQPPPPRLFLPADSPDGVPATPPPDPGPSTGKVIATILLLPIILPVYVAAVGLVVLSSARGSYGYGGGISCKGKIYADGTKWRSSCY